MQEKNLKLSTLQCIPATMFCHHVVNAPRALCGHYIDRETQRTEHYLSHRMCICMYVFTYDPMIFMSHTVVVLLVPFAYRPFNQSQTREGVNQRRSRGLSTGRRIRGRKRVRDVEPHRNENSWTNLRLVRFRATVYRHTIHRCTRCILLHGRRITFAQTVNGF